MVILKIVQIVYWVCEVHFLAVCSLVLSLAASLLLCALHRSFLSFSHLSILRTMDFVSRSVVKVD